MRPRLHLATARLATQAGWMSFECGQHDAARRLWMIALDVARATDHPLGTDQTAFILFDMALQAVELSRPDEAVSLALLGHATAAGPHPVSAATISCLAYVQARVHATQGDATGCDRALGQLAGAHAIAGDTDTAVTVGHQAVDAVTTLHSPRAHARLRILNTALEPLHTSPGVAELRDRLTTTEA